MAASSLTTILSGIGDPALAIRHMEKWEAEHRLIDFLRLAWPQIDPAVLSLNWHHEAIAEHLEAVMREEIPKLLINIPPRCTKTILVNVMFQAFIWAQPDIDFLSGPQVRFLCVSYGETPASRQAALARQLLMGQWYQGLWGDRVKITKDGLGEIQNSASGYRISTSLSGAILGSGGDLILVDDPHSTENAESEIERERTVRLFSEGLTTRRTIPTRTATVVVMQRLHENDVSGHILDSEAGFEHLCLPMEFDPRRYIHSRWYSDIRVEPGELLWPQQFPQWRVDEDRRTLGEYAYAGQMQQRPTPRGGGIIQRLWWRLWPDDSPEMAEQSTVGWCDICRWSGPAYDEEFPCPNCGALAGRKILWPQFSNRMLSVDTSYGDKEENSWSAVTGWGIWHGRDESPRVMLTNAWRGRPKLRTDPLSKEMGLVERVHKLATEMNADSILIEKKTRGVDLYQELEKQVQEWPYRLEYWDPTGRGDKVARLHATTPLFTSDLIWAPNTKWAETVISEVCSQPRARFSDLTDTCTSALLYLRHNGLLNLPDEHRREQMRERGRASVGASRRNNVVELYEGA